MVFEGEENEDRSVSSKVSIGLFKKNESGW